MKSILVLIALILSGSIIGQTLPDSDYLVYLNGSIVDVRSGEVKFDNATYGETRFLSPTEFVVLKASYGASQLVKHDLNTRKQKYIQIPGWLSSNWSYCLSVEDGEINRADIDWSSGAFINKRKLTDLKAFNGASFANSYEDWAFVAPKGYQSEVYLLNTDTKEMISTEYYTIGRTVDNTLLTSPSGRFNYTRLYHEQKKDITKVFDTHNSSFIDLSFIPSEGQRISNYVWLDDNTFFFFYLKTYLRNRTKGMVYLQVVNCLDASKSFEKEFRKIYAGNARLEFQFGNNRSNIHKNENLFFQSLYGNDANTDIRDYQKYLYSLSKENLAEPKKWTKNIGIVNGKNPIDYVSNNLLAYRENGDLLNQGSYLYDPNQGTSEKVSKYVYDNMLQVGNTNYVVFNVNNEVYSYNLETKETKEIASNVRVDKGFYYLK